MSKPPDRHAVYLETGKRRVLAGAIEWPGWCRAGRDETEALATLVTYGPRYAQVLHALYRGIKFPATVRDVTIVERLPGNATTDFGAPAAVPAADERPLDAPEVERLAALLQACWEAFDSAALAAAGRSLRKGPRGGGRALPAITEHVIDANLAYLARLAWKPDKDVDASPEQQLARLLDETRSALRAAAAGELPSRGPRGGKLWLPRYFVRRAAWHMLDHAWEIQDRAL